jgi:hypothetical protein
MGPYSLIASNPNELLQLRASANGKSLSVAEIDVARSKHILITVLAITYRGAIVETM